jgi:hypothetical protein
MTAVAFDPEPVPLTRDEAGRLMVIGSRVPLDTLWRRLSAATRRKRFTSHTRRCRWVTSTRPSPTACVIAAR